MHLTRLSPNMTCLVMDEVEMLQLNKQKSILHPLLVDQLSFKVP